MELAVLFSIVQFEIKIAEWVMVNHIYINRSLYWHSQHILTAVRNNFTICPVRIIAVQFALVPLV